MSQLFSAPLTSQTAPHPTWFFFHPTQTFLSAFVFHAADSSTHLLVHFHFKSPKNSLYRDLFS